MPTWWPKLVSVLGWRDIHWLAWLVQASFQMPQACYTASKEFNNYMVLSTPPCLDHDIYLPMKDPRFGSQDYQLNQPQKTLVYAKALQHWADLANPTPPGESHQLAECIKDWGGGWSHSLLLQMPKCLSHQIGYESPPLSLGKPLSLHPLRNTVMVRTVGLKQKVWDPP